MNQSPLNGNSYIMLNIYNITAVVLFLFSLFTFSLGAKSKKVHVYLLISIIWLILYEGLRWQIGTDWETYYSYFVDEQGEGHVEIGYQTLMNIVRTFTDNYTVLVLILTSFFYLTLASVLEKYASAPLMSLTCYFCLMIGLMGCNRQLLALFICLISLKYCFEKNFIKFVCCVLIAFLFHTTSIIFLISYFIINRNIENKYFVFAVVLSIVIGLSGIINRIPYLNLLVYLDANSAEKLSYYANDDIARYSYLGTIKRIVVLIPCLLRRKQIHDNRYGSFLNMYVIGCIVYFLFNGSMLQIMAARGALYFNIFEILIMPAFIKSTFKGKRQQMFVWLVYFIFIIYIMNRDMNSYVITVGEDIYRPYKSVLF